MTPASMVPIATCRGIDISAPTSGKFAFMKSPFAAHTTMSAVDIYPGGGFGHVAPSPVDGTVMDIREYPSPTPFKERDFMEYVTAIRQGDSIVRILHIKPTVEVGETVAAGDPLGTLIHNGYFYFWNEPPLHVEVRQAGDYIRASNHNPLLAKFGFFPARPSMESEIRCKVMFSDKRYALLKGEYEGQKIKGYGLGGCLLDGLIPMDTWDAIDYFGLIGESVPVPYMASAGNRFMISSVYVKASILGSMPVECRALGFSLSVAEPVIKIIPLTYGQKLFDVGEYVTIRLSLLEDQEVNKETC